MEDTTPTKRLPFKQEMTLEKRRELSERIIVAHPARVPIIVERHQGSTSLPDIPKRKFLSPKDLTLAQFLMEVRKQLQLAPEEAVFWFVDNKALTPGNSLMSQLYELRKDEDGFLYIVYSSEEVFGH